MSMLLDTWAGRFLVAIVCIAAFFGVKALATSGGGSSQPCGIVATGNKLCGGDLAAYCREFVGASLDQGTVEACSSVGVDVVK